MNSLKCHNCGLVNFAGATVCKRCESSLINAPSQQTFVTSQRKPDVRSATRTPSVQLSLVNIVKNDYGALLGLITPVVLWSLFIAVNVFGLSFSRRGGRAIEVNSTDSTFLYIAVGGTVVGIALLAWRIYSFQQTFANGEEIIGLITSVSFFKDRGRIEYSYAMNGQSYKSGNAIMKNKKTLSFQDGDEIELLVNRSNPNRAFIKTLYS